MRKLILITSVVTLMAAPMTVQAVDVTSKVKGIDTAKHTITLSDGKVYQIGQSFDLGPLKVGDRVKVTYDVSGKDQIASKVEIVK
ncbi:DUF1344 domain-containing protein [Hyphomicrobium sp. 2TAF46]|uniref:DUF1344 domain-containing protein n=1 Tax=Hyphomicrobium sp. 2TAF46 TaxID=3233019 RepID=UPI003F920BE8